MTAPPIEPPPEEPHAPHPTEQRDHARFIALIVVLAAATCFAAFGFAVAFIWLGELIIGLLQ